jgi:threonine aldolase
VETNITIFKLTKPGLTPAAFAEQLEPHGVRMIPFGPDLIRAVTHLDVDRAGVHKALKAVEEVMA